MNKKRATASFKDRYEACEIKTACQDDHFINELNVLFPELFAKHDFDVGNE